MNFVIVTASLVLYAPAVVVAVFILWVKQELDAGDDW